MEQNVLQNARPPNTLILKITLVKHVIMPAQVVMDLLLKVVKLALMAI